VALVAAQALRRVSACGVGSRSVDRRRPSVVVFARECTTPGGLPT